MSERDDVLTLIADWERASAPMPMVDILRLAAAEITRLREERRWIPVGERLPVIGTYVLWIWPPRGGCGKFVYPFDGQPPKSATHWQPLPPGPETKEVPCD